ncbi:MAG: serine hydrolase [Flavobacteriales bacterium]|nr:MAG: serine hydrolase [Flavobacteriales bacterium]
MKKKLLITIISVFTSNIVFGQEKVEQLDKLMGLYNEYGQFNGSVLVSENGKVIYKKGFGMANMEWDIPNEANTKHRLGSISKQFTGMLIMQLVEAGKLKLDVPITTYLTDYPKETGNTITLHHLLTHSSGIPNYTSFKDFRAIQRDYYSPTEFVKTFADSTLNFKPGEKFSYSNSGYFLLGVIIEKVTGKTYEEVLQDQILTPLNMTNSGFDHHSTILKNRATGYEKYGSTYINAPFLDMALPYAAGALYSTVEDLYLWDQALYTNQLLTKENMELVFTGYLNGYGYGWGIGKQLMGNNSDSSIVNEHQGGVNGFHTIISRNTTDNNLVVLLNNTGGAALNEMKDAIYGILYGTDYKMPTKSLATELMNIILKNGIQSGVDQFNSLKKSEIYSLNENDMNTVGYQFLQDGKVKEAISIFKLNTEEFATSANTYDSLGEAYLKAGNYKLAIKNYKKTLELNSENPNAIEVLKKLEAK